MSLAEEGAYRRLLDYCWLNGGVPADVKRCARLIGKGATEEIAKVVLAMFIPDPNDSERMIHDRLELERENQRKNSEAKKLAADTRWNKQGTSGDATGKRAKSKSDASPMQTQSTRNADALQMQCSSSSSSTPIKEHGGGVQLSDVFVEIFPGLASDRKSIEFLVSLALQYSATVAQVRAFPDWLARNHSRKALNHWAFRDHFHQSLKGDIKRALQINGQSKQERLESQNRAVVEQIRREAMATHIDAEVVYD